MELERKRLSGKPKIDAYRGIWEQMFVPRITSPSLLRVPIHVQNVNVEREGQRLISIYNVHYIPVVDIIPSGPKSIISDEGCWVNVLPDSGDIFGDHRNLTADENIIIQGFGVLQPVPEKIDINLVSVLAFPPIVLVDNFVVVISNDHPAVARHETILTMQALVMDLEKINKSMGDTYRHVSDLRAVQRLQVVAIDLVETLDSTEENSGRLRCSIRVVAIIPVKTSVVGNNSQRSWSEASGSRLGELLNTNHRKRK